MDGRLSGPRLRRGVRGAGRVCLGAQRHRNGSPDRHLPWPSASRS